MIIYKCDLCNKKVERIDTLILYTKKIDYCEKCKTKATKIRKAMQNSINYYKDEACKNIKKAEENLLKKNKKYAKLG